MALPPILHSGPLPSELDFYATTSPHTELLIVPLVSIDRVRLLTATYGPFRPPQPCRVPLWLAIYLRTKKKALIIPPDWMAIPSLQHTLSLETSQPAFAPLPFEWIGVSNAILRYAAQDVRDAGRVRGLLKDIREARQSKVLAGVAMVNSVHLEMTGISMHEIAELRPFFTTAFQHLKALQPPSAASSSTAAAAATSGAGATDDFDTSFPLALLESQYDVGGSSEAGEGYDQWTHDAAAQPEAESFSLSLSHSADPESASIPALGRDEESFSTDFTLADESNSTALDVPQSSRYARGRTSNVSDSGYGTTTVTRADKSGSIPATGTGTGTGTGAGGDRRPPRFDMDDDGDEGGESMDTF